MVTRKALIITNPGQVNGANYCAGVNRDMENYKSFLMSPIGGHWYEKEITCLQRPKLRDLREYLQSLNLFDYSLVIFSGHGCYSSVSQSTILELNNDESIDSNELRKGSSKQTIILDCCRKIEHGILVELSEMMKAARVYQQLDPSKCRRVYENQIEGCSSGLVVLHACQINETAGDDAQKGGYYSYPLISSAKEWAANKQITQIHPYEILSVAAAHSLACPGTILASGGRQHPTIEKPRENEFFPFAVVA